ncbi:diamine acetyltransferase 1-like isoform X2 [Stegostoma tigrinum]|uniref:diamine acetyltransferase 1-like isoform X2 n=1 Tax=Stegostoma tigrinum TaxID=3053191 RepID=UPI00202B9711|nr:diamine acetyltransferase 1-like isoform X2 [Stegostoma tigrinum]
MEILSERGTELLQDPVPGYLVPKIAIQNCCCTIYFLVMWQNTTSIEYYTRHSAQDLSQQEGKHLFKFSKENMIKLAHEE